MLGYEAKSRGSEESHFKSYKSLRKMARILEREWDLEIVAKTNALKKAANKSVIRNSLSLLTHRVYMTEKTVRAISFLLLTR